MDTTSSMPIRNEYPWVSFKLHDQDYCITTEFVSQMIIQSELTPLSQSPPYMSGLLHLRGAVFPIVDLRILLGMNTLQSEVAAFGSMKEKHLDWIVALEQSIAHGTPFTLARDPHKCMFGLWYDNYHTDVFSLQHILQKIDAPHKELHRQASIIDEYAAKGDRAGVTASYERAKYLCHQVIVPLLDELIDAYTNINKGMIILLEKDNCKLGVLVDNISTIESFAHSHKDGLPLHKNQEQHVKRVIVSETNNRIYLELDVDKLIQLGEHAAQSPDL